MITKKPSGRKAALKYLLTFPLIGILALLFSFSQNNPQSRSTDVEYLLIDNLSAPSALISSNRGENPNTGDSIIILTIHADTISSHPGKKSETESDTFTHKEKHRRETQDTILKNMLVVIDGKIQPKKKGMKTLNELEPASIESITILKDKNALNKYGHSGKNGVVELITKKRGNSAALLLENVDKAASSDTSIRIQSHDSQNQDSEKLLLIVDGKIMGIQAKASALKEIDPNDIESINILKGESAVQKYGEKTIGGAIEISTKNPDGIHKKSETGNAQKDPSEEITVIGFRSQASEKPMNIEGKASTENAPLQEIIVIGHKSDQYKSDDQPESKALIILDGQKIGLGDQELILKQIDPQNIEAISVLKGDSAIDKYGSEGADGVILIETKIPNKISDQRQMELNEFRLFPNPAQRELTIEFEGHPGKYQLNIVDIRGVSQVVKTISNTQYTHTNMDLSGLKAGVYYLIIQSEGKALSRPFVKE